MTQKELEKFYDILKYKEQADQSSILDKIDPSTFWRLVNTAVSEKQSVDRAKLRKPKMINLDEDFIKQNYLKKKTDLTLKINDILYNGNQFFLIFDYYQSFINPKKILEESNYVLKNEKMMFKVIFKSDKEKLYYIDMISKYDKTDKDEEFEQFLFQIDSKEISTHPEKDKESYNKI